MIQDMKKYLLLLLFFIPTLSFSQSEAELLGHWEDPDLIPTSWLDSRYNDVWGTVVDGVEYAIMGSTEGVHFISLADPTNPTEVAFVEGAAIGSQLVHRDYHSHDGYLYTVADEGPSTLQIINMNTLPTSVELIYDSNEFFTRSHNIYIDSLNEVLYSCGGNGGNSLILISIEDPENPQFLAQYTTTTPFPIPRVHDCYVRGNIAYLNCGYSGFYVVDFTNPTDPILLGTMTDYPQSGYNHAGWLSENGEIYYLCDETHGMDVKAVDVSDHSDMNVVALFSAESTDNQIAHNAIVKDHYLYVSYYYDGIQVFDISTPEEPCRVGFYDTFDGDSDGFYQGAWGVYPFLPSGNILISDMNNGLFVVGVKKHFAIPEFDLIELCKSDEASFEMKLSSDFEADVYLSLTGLPLGATVDFSENPAAPGSMVTVTISNFAEVGTFDLNILATDNINSGEGSISLDISDLEDPISLIAPGNFETGVDTVPTFSWTVAWDPFLTPYQFELSTSDVNFEDFIIYEGSFLNNMLVSPEILEQGTTYFWRIHLNNDCGASYSEIFQFTTYMESSVKELAIEGLKVFPNPVSEKINVVFEKAQQKDIGIELLTLEGKQLIQNQIRSNQSQLSIDVGALPAGVYFLKLFLEDKVLTKKVVVE